MLSRQSATDSYPCHAGELGLTGSASGEQGSEGSSSFLHAPNWPGQGNTDISKSSSVHSDLGTWEREWDFVRRTFTALLI